MGFAFGGRFGRLFSQACLICLPAKLFGNMSLMNSFQDCSETWKAGTNLLRRQRICYLGFPEAECLSEKANWSGNFRWRL